MTRLRRLSVGSPAEEFTVSHWTRLEFSSLVAREVRMVDWTPIRLVGLMPGLKPCWTGLRARDALHLAVAKNHHASMIYSLDKALLRAGRILDLRISAGIR